MKQIPMDKVTCSTCGKVRYFDLTECPSDRCWECDGVYIFESTTVTLERN